MPDTTLLVAAERSLWPRHGEAVDGLDAALQSAREMGDTLDSICEDLAGGPHRQAIGKRKTLIHVCDSNAGGDRTERLFGHYPSGERDIG